MKAFWGLIFGLIVSLMIVNFAGESSLHVFEIIFKSAFGTWDDLALTLFYTTSLVFSGLSVAIAFHAGLFNIGVEGQLSVAAAAMTAVGIFLPQIPYPLAPFLALIVAALAGAIWGVIPGVLKAYRGSHEVITTMMMNFLAGGLISWLIQGVLKNPNSQNPESAPIAMSYSLVRPEFISVSLPNTPLNSSFFFSIVLAILLFIYLYRTTWGYELRMVGQNETASEIGGISAKKIKIVAMLLAGIFASFVGMNEILGSAGKYRLGFSPDYGFTGIAVALLARNNPLSILLSAFLFGALHKGASDLDLETQMINRDFAKIIQAIVIFSVASFYFFDFERIFSKNLLLKKVYNKWNKTV